MKSPKTTSPANISTKTSEQADSAMPLSRLDFMLLLYYTLHQVKPYLECGSLCSRIFLRSLGCHFSF